MFGSSNHTEDCWKLYLSPITSICKNSLSIKSCMTLEMNFRVPHRGSVNPMPLGNWDPMIALKDGTRYQSGGHTVWDCKYHIVWTTKYRYPILKGDVGYRCRELLREIAISKEMQIYAGSINRDHVHILIGIPPNMSVSKAVQYLKGKSSHKLMSEYKALKSWILCLKRYFWENFTKPFLIEMSKKWMFF